MNSGKDPDQPADYLAIAMDAHRRSMGDYRGGSFAKYIGRSFSKWLLVIVVVLAGSTAFLLISAWLLTVYVF